MTEPHTPDPDEALVERMLEAYVEGANRFLMEAAFDGKQTVLRGDARRAGMRAALAAMPSACPAGGVPDGYVIVPREPSDYMIVRGAEALDIRPSEARKVYGDMLAAHERETAAHAPETAAEIERLPTRSDATAAAALLLRCNGWDLDEWSGEDGLFSRDCQYFLEALAAPETAAEPPARSGEEADHG